jgi:transposase-like protein
MGQILHKCARTTEIIRDEIQKSEESITFLAKKYGVSRPTIYKWKSADNIKDKPSIRHKLPTVLTELEEQIICSFRRTTQLTLDDCFIALNTEIPSLSRSNLYRCLARNGLNKLPEEEKQKNKKKFKEYDLGFVHIDTTQICLANKQKYYIFVAIERNSKFVFAKVYENKKIDTSAEFLNAVLQKFPFKIHTILTDNGMEYTFNLLAKHLQPKDKIHKFDQVCNEQKIKHKTTKFAHPWTNGQVEIFNKTIKNATTKKYFYTTFAQFETHLVLFLQAYNFGKRLRSLKYLTPFQKLVDYYKNDKRLFNVDIENVNNLTEWNN